MPAVASQRRTLYHSKLREFGPVVAEFSSKPRPSKFPGKPEYCHVIINGQELEYQCETPEIAAHLQDVPLRTPVRIEALGSKDAAVLDVRPAVDPSDLCQNFAGSSPETSRRRDDVPATTAAASQQNRVAPAPVAPQQATCSRDYWEALGVAVALVEQFKKRHGREPSEAERTIATTLYIEGNRSGKPLTKVAR